MRSLAFVALFACPFAAAHAGQDDPVRTKNEKAIAKARAAYQEELEKLDGAVAKYFTGLETAARKKGDKKALDAIQRERLLFDLVGTAPPGAPPALGQKATTAANALAAAYTVAVKEYTKAGRDDLAGDSQKRLDALKALGKDGTVPRYLLLVNAKTGLNASAEKEDGARGSPLVQVGTTHKPNQHWQIVPTADPNVFHIKNRAGGHFFNIGGTDKDKAQLILWDTGGGTNNNFVVARSGDFYTLTSTDSKKFVCGAPDADGSIVCQKEKPEAKEHLWSLVPVAP